VIVNSWSAFVNPFASSVVYVLAFPHGFTTGVIPKPRSIYGDIHYSAGFAEFIWLGKERRSRDFKGGGEDDSRQP
jgi:hypothetical protein